MAVNAIAAPSGLKAIASVVIPIGDTLVAAAALLVAARNLFRTRVGRAFIAIRDWTNIIPSASTRIPATTATARPSS